MLGLQKSHRSELSVVELISTRRNAFPILAGIISSHFHASKNLTKKIDKVFLLTLLNKRILIFELFL